MTFWLAQRLGDSGWSVLANSGGGSCLFQAFSQTIDGQMSPQEIRSLAADRATRTEFLIKRAMYRDAREQLLTSGGRQRRQYLADLRHYGWLEGIETLGQYRAALKASSRWADGETIQHLEDLFNCHLLLVSSTEPSIVLHHRLRDPTAPQRRFVVICNYRDGNHFELVTYRGQRHFDRRNNLPPGLLA